MLKAYNQAVIFMENGVIYGEIKAINFQAQAYYVT